MTACTAKTTVGLQKALSTLHVGTIFKGIDTLSVIPYYISEVTYGTY